MNHQRHLIREALVALLAAGGTAAGARVFENPYAPREVFPALVVEDLGERQDASSAPFNANRTVQRRLLLQVSAEVKQSDTYARQRDQLLADVERLLAGAAVPGLKSITPAGFEADFDMRGELPVAVGRQRFELFYATPQGDPATSL